jgi:hypothetical protein
MIPCSWVTFEKRWVRDQQPGTFAFPQSNNSGDGLYYLDDYTADAHQVHVVGEVVFHPYSDPLPEGGAWRYVSGPPATYEWRVTGDTLTLRPVGRLRLGRHLETSRLAAWGRRISARRSSMFLSTARLRCGG